MAFPTALDDQITDSVSRAGLEVIGGPQAIGRTCQFAAGFHATHNSIVKQQQALTMQTETVHGVSGLGPLGAGSSGKSTESARLGALAGGLRSTCHRRSRY